MSPQALFLSFILIFSIKVSSSTGDSNVYIHCSELSFTSTSPYQSHLNSLFTSLTDSSSACNFNKFQSDNVYGLFQCRGDLSSPDCKVCVTSAVSQLKTTCPTSTGGTIQLEGCFIKYDNTSFFGVEDKTEAYQRCGPSIGYNSGVLNHIESVLSYLVGGNGEYYRGGEFGGVQGVAQCVQDLSLSDCRDCLSEANGRLRSACETSTWGDMYLGKCFLRYVDLGTTAGKGGDNLPNNGIDNPSWGERSGGSKKESLKWVGYIAAALFVMTLLIFAGKYFFFDKNNRKKLMKAFKNLLEGLKKDVGATLSAVKSVEKKVDKIEKDLEKMRECVSSRPPCPPPPCPVPCKPVCPPPCQPPCRPPCPPPSKPVCPPPCAHNPNLCGLL